LNATQSDREPLDILVVEDNRADVVLLKKAFEELRLDHSIHVAIDGDEALAFLYRRPPFSAAPRPALILLDLNLPGRDGREVLEDIKADDELRRIPVVVVTSSRSDVDARQCYDLHANAFMTKGANFDELVALVQQITDYWLSAVRLPPS
jgi:CheY-like chemotaxis protein